MLAESKTKVNLLWVIHFTNIIKQRFSGALCVVASQHGTSPYVPHLHTEEVEMKYIDDEDIVTWTLGGTYDEDKPVSNLAL